MSAQQAGEMPPQDGLEVPPTLADYADRLLISTGLHVEDALLIARGEIQTPPGLEGLARALRAGWQQPEATA